MTTEAKRAVTRRAEARASAVEELTEVAEAGSMEAAVGRITKKENQFLGVKAQVFWLLFCRG